MPNVPLLRSPPIEEELPLTPTRYFSTRRFLAVLRDAPIFPLLIIFVFVILAIFANFIAPHPPNDISLSKKLLPPFWEDGGTIKNPLGTDSLGRDLLSRLIYGSRVSLLVAVITILFSSIFGTILGIISGYFRGWIDTVIMRVVDAFMSFPLLLLAILLAVAFRGPSLLNLIIILCAVLWSRFARLARGEILSWREREFVDLAKVAGCSSKRIMFRHLVPNAIDPIVVFATLNIGHVVIIEAALSFLGAGIPPPTPSWGGIISEGRQYIGSAWWISMFPGLAIMLLVTSFNLFGNWLRDHLDPRLRQIRSL